MTWVSALAIYGVVWWVMLFVVLPFGIVTQEEAGDPIEPGSVSSAPARHRLGRKLAITSVLAAILLAVIWVAVELTGFSLRDLA